MDRQFQEERRTGLGGSDIAAVLGLHPYRTPIDVWMEKTGQLEPFAGNAATRWGLILEPIIAERYAKELGAEVVPVQKMMRHPEHRWMIGHIDYQVRTLAGETPRLMEAKTASARVASRFGEPGTGFTAPEYWAQCAQYALIFRDTMGHGEVQVDNAVLIGEEIDALRKIDPSSLDDAARAALCRVAAEAELRIYHVRPTTAADDEIVTGGGRFWHEYVEAGIPPPAASTEDALKLWTHASSGKLVEATEEMAVLAMELAKASELEKAAVGRRKELRDRLALLLEDAEGAVDPKTGDVIIRCVEQERRGYTVGPTHFRSLTLSKEFRERVTG